MHPSICASGEGVDPQLQDSCWGNPPLHGSLCSFPGSPPRRAVLGRSQAGLCQAWGISRGWGWGALDKWPRSGSQSQVPGARGGPHILPAHLRPPGTGRRWQRGPPPQEVGVPAQEEQRRGLRAERGPARGHRAHLPGRRRVQADGCPCTATVPGHLSLTHRRFPWSPRGRRRPRGWVGWGGRVMGEPC